MALTEQELDRWIYSIQEKQQATAHQLNGDLEKDDEKQQMKLLSLLNGISVQLLKLKQHLKR